MMKISRNKRDCNETLKEMAGKDKDSKNKKDDWMGIRILRLNSPKWSLFSIIIFS